MTDTSKPPLAFLEGFYGAHMYKMDLISQRLDPEDEAFFCLPHYELAMENDYAPLNEWAANRKDALFEKLAQKQGQIFARNLRSLWDNYWRDFRRPMLSFVGDTTF